MKVTFPVMSYFKAVEERRPEKKIQAYMGFFFFFFFQAHYCKDFFHIQVFIRRSNIWLSYIHSRFKQTKLER